MLNMYDSVRSNPSFHKLQIGDLLFAQYTCPIGTSKLETWTHVDHVIHVISGRKTWHAIDGAWTATPGDTMFFRKGASILEQFFDQDFCLLIFFVPDNLVRHTARELAGSLTAETAAGRAHEIHRSNQE